MIHYHYQSLAGKLTLENYRSPHQIKRHCVVVLIAGVHRGSLIALTYAQTLSADVTAVHVSVDPQDPESAEKMESVRRRGPACDPGIPLPVAD